ncbi:MAG: hypothetical protein ABJK11_07555 [Balneola sp.]
MRRLTFLAGLALIMLSFSLSAQDMNPTQFDNEINQHSIFHQHNSLNDNLFGSFSSDNSFGDYRFLPTPQSLRYNRVDALFIGIGTDFSDPNSEVLSIGGLDFDGFIGYSTGQSDWQYRTEVTKHFSRSFEIGAELFSTSTTDDYWRTELTENSITSLVAGYDYHDYYKAEGYGIFSEANLGRYLSFATSYNYTVYNSLSNNSSYAFFDGGNIGRLNPGIDSSTDNLTQNSIGIQLGINKKGYTKGTFTSKFIAIAELSNAADFDNDFLYNKFEITSFNYLKLDKNTLLKIRVKAGSITGSAPDFKNFYLGGIGSLRATGYKFHQGNKMLLSNAELIFGDFWEFDKGHLEVEGLYLSLFMDSGWTDFISNNSTDPFSGFENFAFNKLTHNIGSGIGTSFIRFEVATPIAGSEGFTSFWIRLNPTF